MLETAEQGHRLSKSAYAHALPKLRETLLNAQFALAQQARGAVLILFSGIEGGGRSETTNTLNAWMDPRHIRTIAFPKPTCEARKHPPAWRYWRALPPRGTIGIFSNAWYAEAFRLQARGHASRFEQHLGALSTYAQLRACT